ncbi:MAG: RluA family pseudouridine synthase [Elusimicrobia bacterium]|nr:RluA family pseudouridine synthase [Elusimicrobiota bacterium]
MVQKKAGNVIMAENEWCVESADGERLDLFLVRHNPGYSRGYFQKLIKNASVLVNGVVLTPHYAVRENDMITVRHEDRQPACVGEDISLDIIHEDDDILLINKPVGLVVHPACGHAGGTLLNALYGHARGAFVPFLVHRLDKNTSGVIVTVKNEKAKKSLVAQFQKRAVKKVYRALVKGVIIEQRVRIEAPIGRSQKDRKIMMVGPLAKKMAVTELSVIRRDKDYSCIEAYPVTGRTHQIRCHLAYIGHPVAGDTVYGGPEEIAGIPVIRQLLHAYSISFNHPGTGKRVEYGAPMPDDMKKWWGK